MLLLLMKIKKIYNNQYLEYYMNHIINNIIHINNIIIMFYLNCVVFEQTLCYYNLNCNCYQ